VAIFTALATFLLAGTFLAGSALATGALALGLGLATTIGVSYVMKALAGTPAEAAKQDSFGTQGTIAAGGFTAETSRIGRCGSPSPRGVVNPNQGPDEGA